MNPYISYSSTTSELHLPEEVYISTNVTFNRPKAPRKNISCTTVSSTQTSTSTINCLVQINSSNSVCNVITQQMVCKYVNNV